MGIQKNKGLASPRKIRIIKSTVIDEINPKEILLPSLKEKRVSNLHFSL
jgi:hypothetical protein